MIKFVKASFFCGILGLRPVYALRFDTAAGFNILDGDFALFLGVSATVFFSSSISFSAALAALTFLLG